MMLGGHSRVRVAERVWGVCFELFNRSVRNVRRCDAIGEYVLVTKAALHDDANVVNAARDDDACKATEKGLIAFMTAAVQDLLLR
jgi:hypothetical protein